MTYFHTMDPLSPYGTSRIFLSGDSIGNSWSYCISSNQICWTV